MVYESAVVNDTKESVLQDVIHVMTVLCLCLKQVFRMSFIFVSKIYLLPPLKTREWYNGNADISEK